MNWILFGFLFSSFFILNKLQDYLINNIERQQQPEADDQRRGRQIEKHRQTADEYLKKSHHKTDQPAPEITRAVHGRENIFQPDEKSQRFLFVLQEILKRAGELQKAA